jgi:hypothetical protein
MATFSIAIGMSKIGTRASQVWRVCRKNRYSREASLASMMKIGYSQRQVWQVLHKFGKFVEFGESCEFGECRIDGFIHIKYVFCA